MKLKKLAMTAAASALVLGMSMTSFAEVGYYEWYTSRYGNYDYTSDEEIQSDPVYYQYLEEVYGYSPYSYTSDDYDYYYDYYYDYDGKTYAYVEDAYWSGSTAKWDIDGKASKYQVRLYRDDKKITTKDTKSKSYGFSGSIDRAGYYYFEVRAYNKTSGWSSWVASDDKYFSGNGSTASSSAGNSAVYIVGPNGPTTSAQWIQTNDGTGRWWYKHADGGCTKNGWEQINGKWYYFDDAGWMKTGWLNVGGFTYYLGSDGAMLTGYNVIDGAGHNFDASGKMLN